MSDKQTVKVSVIVPMYNSASTIGRALKSVLSQTYGDFEVIVVDDGSTDKGSEVVAAFIDSRIHYVRHESNRGGTAARNTGVKNSTGEFIAFLDSDDEWLPEKIKKQLQVFESASSGVGVVYTGWRWIRDADKTILQEKVPAYRGNIFKIILEEDGIGSLSTPLIRKDILVYAGCLDEQLPARQDWDLWIRLAKCCGVDFVPEVLVNYYLHPGSISTNIQNKINGTELVIEKYRAEFNSCPEILTKHFILLTILYLIINNVSKARRLMLSSVKLSPFNIKVYWKFLVHLIVSFLPIGMRKSFFVRMRRINKDFYWIYPTD